MDYAATQNNKYLDLLVAQFNLPLYHFLLSQSNKELAEDVLQTTWLKVMKTVSKEHSHTNVKSWLFTIARNTLLDELRQQKKWQWQEFNDDLVHVNNLSKTFDKNNELAQFNEALSSLPFYQREAFIFQQEGFSVIEICQLTDESFETIKSRLRYARQNLKTLIGSTS